MSKILVDTSVWIDSLNGIKNKHSVLLNKFIEQDSTIVLCPIIVQEVLQGIRDDKQFEKVKHALSGFEILSIEPVEAAYGAAKLYRDFRKKGITIRKSNDCLIAFYAIYFKVQLFHNDSDFTRIAKHLELKIISAS